MGNPSSHGLLDRILIFVLCSAPPLQDGRLPAMRKHKVMCEDFGNGNSEILPSETYYETTSVADHHSQDDGTIEEQEEYDMDTLVETDPSPKRKKQHLMARRPMGTPRPLLRTPQQQQSPVGVNYSPATPASPFAHAVRAWERKLNDLPLAQALQIEKYVNDMLYDASLANVQQTPPQAPIIKVNITAPSMQQDHSD